MYNNQHVDSNYHHKLQLNNIYMKFKQLYDVIQLYSELIDFTV